jgi:hypothetical protein
LRLLVMLITPLLLISCTKEPQLTEATYTCFTQRSCYSCYYEKRWPNHYTLEVKCRVGQNMCAGTQQVWLTEDREIYKMSECKQNKEDFWKLEEKWR